MDSLLFVKECVLQLEIDTEDKAFWRESLETIKSRIDEFLELIK